MEHSQAGVTNLIGLEITALAPADELVPYESFYLGTIERPGANPDTWILRVRLYRPFDESWREYDGLNPIAVQTGVPYFRVLGLESPKLRGAN